MEPLELMARLAALVLPPWQSLTRFHWVLAPHHAWRSSFVPEKTAEDHGQAPLAALFAAGPERLLPILMTSAAVVLGLRTVVRGGPSGAHENQPRFCAARLEGSAPERSSSLMM
jgi:hypothetical protein